MIAIAGIGIISGRRPMRSDSAGIANEASVAEMPSVPMSQPIVEGVVLAHLREDTAA